jgi:hypothetical protein
MRDRHHVDSRAAEPEPVAQLALVAKAQVVAAAVAVWYLTTAYGVNDLGLTALEWAGLGLVVVVFGT